MKVLLLLLALALIGGLAWIRLAPSDAARWHRMASPPGASSGWVLWAPGTDPVSEGPDGARAVMTLFDETPEDVLTRLDGIALATPRTRRLAGSPSDGMITWVTRSAVFGFPDYTTAAAQAVGPTTFLSLHARQRFGRKDFGVNAARLRDWLQRLAP